jgi:hypothetical protein
MTDSKAPTHIAYGRVHLGKRFGPWLEIGFGRLDNNGVFHGLPNRAPIGGAFNGYIYYAPIGAGPPPDEPARPAQSDTDNENPA